MINFPAWVHNFCAKYLVADDPAPYAKESTGYLISFYLYNPTEAVQKELEVRLKSGLLTEAEATIVRRIGIK